MGRYITVQQCKLETRGPDQNHMSSMTLNKMHIWGTHCGDLRLELLTEIIGEGRLSPY